VTEVLGRALGGRRHELFQEFAVEDPHGHGFLPARVVVRIVQHSGLGRILASTPQFQDADQRLGAVRL